MASGRVPQGDPRTDVRAPAPSERQEGKDDNMLILMLKRSRQEVFLELRTIAMARNIATEATGRMEETP